MKQWLFILAIDGARYAVFASLAFALFWIWKWDALEHRRIQKRRPSRKSFSREIRYSISTVFIFATVGFGVFQLQRRGVFDLYEHVSTRGWPYWFASIGFAILIHDTYFYWTHRAMHHPALFKRVHRVHHLSTNPSPWAAYAFGPIEALIAALIVPTILVFIPMHQIALFVFLLYMIVMNVLGHLGIELYPRGFVRSRWTRWLSTTTHHNLHHRDFHGNYGLYFTWWDRLLRTQHEMYEMTYAAVTQQPLRSSTTQVTRT